jgi:DNA-binding NtrC family response regulator
MAKNSAAACVLVVDDEPLIRWSLSEMLADRGYEVIEVGDAEGALRAVSNGSASPEVVLLDFRLPDSNDLGLLSMLRRLLPRAQIVLMTAFGTPEVVQEALDLGAFRVVSKPFNVNEVVLLVAEAVRTPFS